MKIRDRGLGEASFGLRMSQRWSRRRIERRMKDQHAQRTQAVVGDDLGLRAELANRVSLVEVSEGDELRAQDQRCGSERNRSCARAYSRAQ